MIKPLIEIKQKSHDKKADKNIKIKINEGINIIPLL